MITRPSVAELADSIAGASRAAILQLFKEHRDHHFYYCSLITTGEGHAPALCAWSNEALAAVATDAGLSPEAVGELKWSYADSPFYCFGAHHFESVDRQFALRPPPDLNSSGDFLSEVGLRLNAMEAAMARLDREGLFGSGSKRHSIVINVEVMPPDHTNTARALRLNPPEALVQWLAEVAEPE